MAAQTRTFEIHIGPADGDGAFPIHLQVRPDQRRASGVLRLPLDSAAVDRALGWMERGGFARDITAVSGRPGSGGKGDAAVGEIGAAGGDRGAGAGGEGGDVRAFGAALFGALFAGDVGDVYRQALAAGGDGPARFRLIVGAPAAARIPWELLYDPDRGVFLALDGMVVRDIATKAPAEPIEVDPPLRVLVVTPSPAGVPPVQDWTEAAGIRAALAGLVHRRHAEIAVLPDATLAAVQNALREAADPERPRPFHVLHFIGHGEHDAATGRTALLFEHEDGTVDPVDAEALANVIRPYGVKLVFLNACQSVQASALEVTGGMAPMLLERGIPAVIGMQVTVLDALAVRFARTFYDALGDNAPVDAALSEARRLTRSAGRPGGADMGIPVCYLRTDSGHVLRLRQARGTPLTRATWRPWLRERLTPLRAGALALGIVTAAVSLDGFVRLPAVQAWACERLDSICLTPPMSGDLNIAVARFGTSGDATAETAAAADALAQSTFEFLDTELKGLIGAAGASSGPFDIDIQVRGPDQTGRVAGADRTARAEAASALAHRINADVVIYGDLAGESSGVRLNPEFYVSDRSLALAEELAGQYEFGAALRSLGDIEGNPIARARFKERLGERIRALAQFVFGLGYYSLREYPDAAAYFRQAEASPDWARGDGKEVLYLFIGKAAGKLRDWPAAGRAFADALSIEPEFARARLGAAEVVFQQAHADCTSQRADGDGLRRAEEGFLSALVAKVQPALSDVPTNAAFALGRVYLCLSQAEVEDRWADARRSFEQVLAEHARGNLRITEIAIEAQANLGLIEILTAADNVAAAGYAAAVDAYGKAIDLNATLASPRPEREALFRVWQAWCYLRLEDRDRAADALTGADALYGAAPAFLHNQAYEKFRKQVGDELGSR